MSRRVTLLNYAIVVWLVIISFTVAYFGYLVAVDNQNEPVRIEILDTQASAIAGGTLDIAVDIDRKRACVIGTQRTFENLNTRERFETPATEKVIQKVEHVNTNFQVKLPDTLPVGPYILKYQLNYYCNLSNSIFGPIIYNPPDIFFEVIG